MLWELLAVLFCTLFGAAHILNVFTVGDGLWFWYAALVRHGSHLYSGLHVNQQPLFILLTAGALALFGRSWLAFRIFPLIQVVVFSAGLLLVARYIPWRDRYRAPLILAAFGMTMTIFYYRFDDYHVTTQILQVISLWLLLLLDEDPRPSRALWIAGCLGLLSGLSFTNRLNDGAALLAASGIAVFGSAFRNRLAATLVFVGAAVVCFASILLLTRDTLSQWFFYTVVQAAQIKGGSGRIWLYPILLPFKSTLRFLSSPHAILPLVYVLTLVVCLLISPIFNRDFQSVRRRKLLFTAWLILLPLSTVYYFKNLLLGSINDSIADLAVPFAYALFVVIIVRFVRHLRGSHVGRPWHARELLLLIPMLQLFLAAMTGGKGMTESTPAMALSILLLPIVTPVPFSANMRRGLALIAALIAIAAFPMKYVHPFAWHDYRSGTMFSNRVWYRHPILGPMYVDTQQLAMMRTVCDEIRSEPGELLSIPYPHANYFCNQSPWHGYVQTWYDTSSRELIHTLVRELSTAPPTWIFDERNLRVIQGHEAVYNNNKPLPQRDLDALIMLRLRQRKWTVVFRRCLNGGDWLLIRTSPPKTEEKALFPVLQDKHLNLCERTANYL